MFETLTFLHSVFRWLVLISLVLSIYTAYSGLIKNKPFSKGINSLRHWTATIAHVQLILGIYMYMKSPTSLYFLHNTSEASKHLEILFFGLIHPLLMLTAIILITIGSALSKRKPSNTEKYKTLILWFGIGLAIILVAIPWPFSPFAHRPYFR